MRLAHQLCVPVLLLAGSAAAQTQTGSHIRPAPAQIPDGAMDKADRARIAMDRYAECVIAESRSRVERYLQSFPGSRESVKLADRLSTDDCLSTGEMRFSEALFRGSAFDQFYKTEFGSRGPTDFSATPQIDYTAGSDADGYGDARTKIALRQMADCAVRAGPAEARALVLTRVTSKSEGQAFSAFVPHLSACVPQGLNLKFSRSVLRGYVSEAIYRLSAAATRSAS